MFVCALCIPDELGFSLAERCSIKDYVLDYAETYKDCSLTILCFLYSLSANLKQGYAALLN